MAGRITTLGVGQKLEGLDSTSTAAWSPTWPSSRSKRPACISSTWALGPPKDVKGPGSKVQAHVSLCMTSKRLGARTEDRLVFEVGSVVDRVSLSEGSRVEARDFARQHPRHRRRRQDVRLHPDRARPNDEADARNVAKRRRRSQTLRRSHHIWPRSKRRILRLETKEDGRPHGPHAARAHRRPRTPERPLESN